MTLTHILVSNAIVVLCDVYVVIRMLASICTNSHVLHFIFCFPGTRFKNFKPLSSLQRHFVLILFTSIFFSLICKYLCVCYYIYSFVFSRLDGGCIADEFVIGFWKVKRSDDLWLNVLL